MKTFLKVATVYTNNFQPGELIHMDYAFYNMTSIRGFTSMLTVVCANTIVLWLFPNSSKWAPFCIIHFILTTLKNEQHLCKQVIVEKYGTLAKSIDVTNLNVYYFSISMKTTCGDTSWLNVNNEIINISIQDMVRAGLIGSNQHFNNGAV